jgi:hypothetical protein
MLQRLSGINCAEMPNREQFDETLWKFVFNLHPDLRETACLETQVYATLASSLAEGSSLTAMSPRLRIWAACHRLCSGSDRRHLILAPRDPFFRASPKERERMVTAYHRALDGPPQATPSQSERSDNDEMAGADAQFERLPVQPQIYDCLAYVHRGHAASAAMMMSINKLNIVCFALVILPGWFIE